MKKSIFLVLLLISLLLTACGGGSSGGDEERILKEIKLSANKTTIKDDGKEEVTFSITCFDTDNNEYNADVKLYNGDNEVKGNTFSSKETGTFTFIAKSKDLTITSNSISIIVISDVIQNNNSMMKEYVYKHYDEKPSLYNLYEYNEKGLLIKTKRYQYTFGDGDYFYLNFIWEYEYNDDNRLIKQTRYRGEFIESIFSYEYDNDGNIIKELEYKKNSITGEYDKLDTYREYTYDDNNNLIKKEHCVASSNDKYLYLYEYDENNNLIKEDYYGLSITKQHSYFYEYDENNNLIKSFYSSKYDNYYSYKYDENNNLIQITYCVGEIGEWVDYGYEVGYIIETTTYTYGKYNDFINDMVELPIG